VVITTAAFVEGNTTLLAIDDLSDAIGSVVIPSALSSVTAWDIPVTLTVGAEWEWIAGI